MNAAPDDAPDYLSFVAFEAPGHEHVLLRWLVRDMPLKVYVPRPPGSFFPDSDEILDATRRAVVDWSGSASEELPTFLFVDSAAEADVPIALG